jgi:amino acid adenylation domain-containing protein
VFPLSKQQELIWLHQQIAPESRAYYFTAIVDLRGQLDTGALRGAIAESVNAHDAMRLQLCGTEDAIAAQQVLPDVNIEIPEHDLRHADDLEEVRLEMVSAQAHREFDLGTAPLARWTLLRIEDAHWQLVHTEHHLIHDGRSFGTFLEEVLTRYATRVGHAPAGRIETVDAPGYEEYVAYTESPTYVAEADRAVAWWVDRLEDAEHQIDFSGLGMKRFVLRDFSGGQYRQILPAELMTAVAGTAKSGGYTVFAALFSGFAELCRRHSGQRDLVIGTALPNRPPRFERTVGMMVNSVALRFPGQPEATGHQSARAAMTALFDALDHQMAPIQDVVRGLDLSAADRDNPLFNVMFSMNDRPLPETLEIPGLELEVYGGLNERCARFDIDVVVLPPTVVFTGGSRAEYTVVWDYSTQRFSASEIKLLADRFEYLLRRYAAEPELLIGEIELEPARTPTPSEEEAEPAQRAPEWFADSDAAAVVFGAHTLTYRELGALVEERRVQLQKAGLGAGDVLALRLPRGIDAIVYLLACLRSKIVFAPLSTTLPRERLAAIVTRLEPAAVLATAEGVVDFAATDSLLLNAARPDQTLRPGGGGVPQPNAAYLIHTSGSTGVSKGVAVPEDSLDRIVEALVESYELVPGDVVMQFTDPAFDVFIEEVLPTLRAGACIVIPRHEAPTGQELGALLLARGVSVLNIPTNYALSVAEALDEAISGRAHRLRLLVVGGERLPAERMRRLAAIGGGPRVLNAYGVTEAVITSTYFEWDAEQVAELEDVPIGRVLKGVRLRILDGRHRELGRGMVGEIAIAVPGTGARYATDQEANDRRFVRVPADSGQLFYLTGDRGYESLSGDFHFLGRLDRQVKVNGFRVELEEIELAVKTVRPAADCAVTVMHSSDGTDILAGCLAGVPESSLDGLEKALSGLLPRYAVPRRWTLVSEIPRHPTTGKVDFAALKLTDAPTEAAAAQAARTATAESDSLWLRAFRDVLDADGLTGDSDFFRVGGHSLLVFRLISRYEGLAGWRPPASLVFEHATPRALEAETARLREPAAVESGRA